MEVCRATPPSTPLRRHTRKIVESPRVSSRRRSLFKEESDLSDISPLSPSSEDKTPKKKTPKKVDCTPLRGMTGLSSLSLNSPGVRVHSEGIRMKGVSALDAESQAVIPPNKFYGSHTEPRPPRTWIRKEVSKAKTKLFLEDIPKDRKRARTSSGHKVQPPAKRQRTASRAPVPMLGQSRSGGKPKKKSSPPHRAKDTSFRDANVTIDENSDTNLTKDFVTTEKDIEDIVGRDIMRRVRKHTPLQVKEDNLAGNWEVSFTKESRLSDVSSTPTSDRKFFKSQANTTPKMVRRASTALTPPWSSHKSQNLMKRRSLCKPNYVFSPNKTSPLRRSPRKAAERERQLIIQSISRDVTEMMEDEPCLNTKQEVDVLIQQLHQSEVKQDWSSALPSPEEDLVEEPTTPSKPVTTPSKLSDSQSKLYPIFRSGGSSHRKPSTARNSGGERSRKYLGMGSDQYQIDSGQDSLREVQCHTCGMVYSRGCPEDEILHSKHHAHLNRLSYHGWKKERVVRTRDGDKVICVLKDDPKSWWNKVMQVVQLVDDYLGFPQTSLDSLLSPQIYLYIRDKEIVGCLVSEQISQGYRLLSLEKDVDLCSSESYPACCGVSRLWVSPRHRRLSIATCLLNSLRSNFAYGCILSKEQLAFTVPTDDGKKFISKYMGQDTGYLVYI